MRIAPTGRPTTPKRGKPIGDAQRQLLQLLIDQPGLDANRVTVLLGMRNVHQATLALQGLVNRGFASWQPGKAHGNLLYYVTSQGRAKVQG